MRKSTLACFLLVALAFPSKLHAECSGGGTVAGMKREAALVFEGTVVKVDPREHETEAAATLRVHRVWKGDVTEDMAVYYILGGPDGPFFEVGRRAVVFAFRMNSNAEQLHYVMPHAPAGAAWTTSCKGPLQLDEAGLKQLGRSRKPLKK